LISWTANWGQQQGILDKRVSLVIENQPVEEALERIMKETSSKINYSLDNSSRGKKISKTYKNVRLAEVIKDILGDNNLGLRARGNSITVFKKSDSVPDQSRAVLKGEITDAQNQPLFGVTVRLRGTGLGAISDEAGRFRIHKVPFGDFTLEVSSMGYETITRELRVNKKLFTLSLTMGESREQLQEVVVKGKSESTRISEQPLQINSIDVVALQNESSEVVKILDRTAGVRIRQFGGLGSPVQIQLNGLSGNAVRTYYDGIPLELLGGGIQLNNIPANAVERLDVYKGVMPVDIGTDALAGGINVVAKEVDTDYVNASYQFGSFNSHVGTLSAGKKIGSKAFLSLQGFQNYADNDYRIRAVQIMNNENVPVEVDRFHDAHRSSMIQGTFGFTGTTWADKISYSISYNQRFDEVQNGVRLDNSPIGELTTENSALLQSLKYQKKLAHEKLGIDYSGHYVRTTEQINDSTTNRYDWFGNIVGEWARGAEFLAAPSRRRGENEVWVHRLNLGYDFNDTQSVTLSTFLSDQTVAGEDPLFDIPDIVDPNTIPSNLLRSISGISYESKWFDKKLEAIVFGKYYHYNQSTTVLNPNPNIDVGGQFSFNDGETGYGLGLKYSLGNDIFLRASFERALRIPTTREIFGDFVTIQPNYTLRPELSENVNLGGHFTYNYGRNNYVTVDINGFLRDQTDLIRLQALGLANSRFINEAEVRASGFELAVNAMPLDKLRLSLSYTTQSIFKEGDASGNNADGIGSDIPNIPTRFLNFSADYALGKTVLKEDEWNVFGYYTYVDEFAITIQNAGSANPENSIPVQHQVDLGTKYRFSKANLTVALQVNNVLDREVFDNFRIPKPGRNFNIKLSYQL
ncbi:MAG: TonB-dependent receptor, partial [Bacteroidota bacterium]